MKPGGAMKFAIAVHGTRGDVEPATAVARELNRRGHEVRLGVPPDLTSFVDSAGLPGAVGYGIESQEQVESEVFRNWWKPRNPMRALRDVQEYAARGWSEMSRTLSDLAVGADLILTGTTYQEIAANVAEQQGLPMAALHYFPARPNSKISPVRLPAPVVKSSMAAAEWAYWRLMKPTEDAQRHELGLPDATARLSRRLNVSGGLEIQAYDPVIFPGLDEEWQGRRPFVGSITLELETAGDQDVADWIASDAPPIYFGFGSTPVDSPQELVAMITDVCAELGERVLFSSTAPELANVAHSRSLKIVKSVHYPTVFPKCRAVVHHGGAGTLSAGIRAGVPTLALWSVADQPIWALAAQRLEVGKARRFSRTTHRTLLSDLRTVLAPEYTQRTQQLAAGMIKPSEGVLIAADLLEKLAADRSAR